MLNIISSKDITEFISELALLLTTQITCKEALNTIQQGQEKPAMQKMINTIQNEVEQSGSLSAGLAHYPRQFEPVIVEMIRDGEQQDHLSTTLAKIANYREANDEVVDELTTRLVLISIYPALLLFVVLLIATGLLIFVVPVFSAMFKDFGADLPASTAAVVWISDFTVQYWAVILGGIFLLALFLEWSRRRGQLFLYIPFLNYLFHKAMLIRFLRGYALLYSPTISPQKTLEGCIELIGNIPYAHCLRQLTEQVKSGQTFPEVLIQQPHFPKKFGHLTAVGLKTQKVDELFNKTATRYAKQLQKMLEFATKALFIIAIVTMGLLVGFFVVAMYMPIFAMGSVI